MFLMFAGLKLTNTVVGPGHRPHDDPAAVQPVRDAQQLRGRPAGARGGRGHRRRRAAAGPVAGLPAVPDAGHRDRRPVRVHHVVERVPRGDRDDEQGVGLHPAGHPRRRPHRDEPGRHRLGDAPGRGDDLDHPVRRSSTCCCSATTCRGCSAGRSSDARATSTEAADPADDRQRRPAERRRVGRSDRWAAQVRLDGGFWGDRQAINRARTHPARLRAARARPGRSTTCAWRPARAARTRPSATRPARPSRSSTPTSTSGSRRSAGSSGAAPTRASRPMADEAIALVAAAQRPDGYLNSYVQVVGGGTPFQDLAWGHELYCIGHLIQAAVAWHRALGDDRLLAIARRRGRRRGPGPRRRRARRHRRPSRGRDGPRRAVAETGERRYLDLARARSTCAATACWARAGSDRSTGRTTDRSARPRPSPATPSASCTSTPGAVDVAVETGDRALLDAVIRRWTDMVATRAYLTGGLGSRHRDEAFGDPFELPPDRAYAETCAAIASVMLAWRLLLATGEPRFADHIERTDATTACCPACRSTGRASSTSTRSSGGATARRRPTPTARARRGTRARAARPT